MEDYLLLQREHYESQIDFHFYPRMKNLLEDVMKNLLEAVIKLLVDDIAESQSTPQALRKKNQPTVRLENVVLKGNLDYSYARFLRVSY